VDIPSIQIRFSQLLTKEEKSKRFQRWFIFNHTNIKLGEKIKYCLIDEESVSLLPLYCISLYPSYRGIQAG
jgi:dynactin complex subunit